MSDAIRAKLHSDFDKEMPNMFYWYRGLHVEVTDRTLRDNLY